MLTLVIPCQVKGVICQSGKSAEEERGVSLDLNSGPIGFHFDFIVWFGGACREAKKIQPLFQNH
jgi:hypothetical protein